MATGITQNERRRVVAHADKLRKEALDALHVIRHLSRQSGRTPATAVHLEELIDCLDRFVIDEEGC